MAKDASKVRVALTGSIIVAEPDTPDPTSFTGLAGLGADLGYTTEDGVTFTFSKDTEDIMGWQSLEPLRRLVTGSPKTAAFTLRQLERATWLATMGGNITKKGDLYLWEPDDSFIPTKKLFIHFKDGDCNYLFGFRRSQQMAEVEMNLVRNDAVNLPNEWSALAAEGDETSWFMLTDDPAFAAAANTSPAPKPPATTATAGSPGSFDGAAPANLAALGSVAALPTTAWATGQSVRLADGSQAHWDGSAWAAGAAA